MGAGGVTDADFDDTGGFDSVEKIQILLKGLLNVPSTQEGLDWYLETKGKYDSIIESNSINTTTAPTIPTWNDISLNTSEMSTLYGLSMSDFANSDHSYGLHNVYDGTSYTTTGTIKPGIYSSDDGLLHLFVRLKLELAESQSAGYAFTKYNGVEQILSNSFQFNYNQFIDSEALIQPYLYSLEWISASDETSGIDNYRKMDFNVGNWSFDFKSGILTFSDNPIATIESADTVITYYDINIDDGNYGDGGTLYFTFVKYVGPRGLDKLISVDDAFDSTYTTGYYENQIVVDSSNSEIYLMKDNSWNSIGGGGGGSGGSGPVNNAGQTFHELVTGAPQAFTKGDTSSPLFNIDISWSFEDIQTTEYNNRMFNFPLPKNRERVIPYIEKIWFDISSSEAGDIDLSASITINDNDNYAEDYNEINGNISSGGANSDLSYNFTYRTLTLTKVSEDTRTYTVNVWGVNDSNETQTHKLTFSDISFTPNSKTTFTTSTGNTYYTTRTNVDVSGIITAVDSDADDDGKDVSFGIHKDVSYGSLTISQTNNILNWIYAPNTDFSGNDTFTIRTYSEIDGIIIDSNNGYTGFTSDISINISVNDPTEFTGDLSVNTNVGEDISGIVSLYDPNSSIIYDISNDLTNGALSYSSTPSDASFNPTTNVVTINWYYTAAPGFTGEESFTIIATDVIGGISSQKIIIKIPYIYEITDYGSLDTNMISVHDNLNPVGISVSVTTNPANRYDLSGNQNNSGYQFDVYKVDETASSKEYLPSNMTTYGLAGINLSYIMNDKVFKDHRADGGDDLSYVETDFYDSLSDSTYNDDIIVYIVATNKSTGEHFMARINKDLPGFDEMNPWYFTNKVNSDSTLNELSSGLGSGALPSLELQTDISNNSASNVFNTSQINGHDPIIIHINSNAFEDHYFYFATKLYS